MKAAKPGISHDPWRTPQVTQDKPPMPSSPLELEDFGPERRQAIQIDQYGGMSVDQNVNPKKLAHALLDFLVDNRNQVDTYLNNYGLVLAKLSPGELDVKFYIIREDGWTLAAPAVTSRQDGLFQLLQAVLCITADPVLKKKFNEHGLSAFKH